MGDLQSIRQAAEQGDPKARRVLGRMYATGDDVARDLGEAFRWYGLAAEQGDAQAQNALAWMYFNGEGTGEDSEQAAMWYLAAAEQGDPEGQKAIASMYQSGEGMPRDPTRAFRWFREAAQRGDAQAQSSVAWMYYRGHGAEQDFARAAAWYRKAADRGEASAQNALGSMYQAGVGVQRDLSEAIRWYRAAADQEFRPAAEALAALRTAPRRAEAGAFNPLAQPGTGDGPAAQSQLDRVSLESHDRLSELKGEYIGRHVPSLLPPVQRAHRRPKTRAVTALSMLTVVALAGAAGWVAYERPEWLGLAPMVETMAPVAPSGYASGEVIRDCDLCPEMVPVGSSRFRMGGNGKDEQPVHWVHIVRPFAIGKYEVSFDEYERFARQTERVVPFDQGWGAARRPVIGVSWDDARAYAEWLSEKNGERYRLPTEAEWEYVARGGTATRYWWGDEVGLNRANCRDCGSEWSGKQTAPVGSFESNALGVADTAGNVWEWLQDCWHDSYAGAPDDGSAWETGACVNRVVRGGAWNSKPEDVRSAGRDKARAGNRRHDSIGIRLARDL